MVLRALPRRPRVARDPATDPVRSRRGCDASRELWPEVDGYAYFNNDTGGCAVRDAIVFARAAARAGIAVTRVPDVREAPVGQVGRSRSTSAAGLSVR